MQSIPYDSKSAVQKDKNCRERETDKEKIRS